MILASRTRDCSSCELSVWTFFNAQGTEMMINDILIAIKRFSFSQFIIIPGVLSNDKLSQENFRAAVKKVLHLYFCRKLFRRQNCARPTQNPIIT